MIIKDIFEEDVERDEYEQIINNSKNIMILKFGADWCGPCKKIAPLIDMQIDLINMYMEEKNIEKDVYYYELCVDDYFDLYAFLKRKKMINGIPHMVCYFPENNQNRDYFYIPDFSVSGSKEDDIKLFFNTIKDKL